MVIDMSQGTPDHAWPADPYWRDKIRIAKQARELGQALRTGLPTSFRPALVGPETSSIPNREMHNPEHGARQVRW